MFRDRLWHTLQAQVFTMTQTQGGTDAPGGGAGMRESAYRLFAGCPNLVIDLQTDAVLGVFQRGLQIQCQGKFHPTSLSLPIATI